MQSLFDLLGILSAKEARVAIAELTPEHLRKMFIEAIDSDERTAYRWSVWECLHGELEYENRTYVFEEGDFYCVEQKFIEDLDTYVAGLPLSRLAFPVSPGDVQEADYNRTLSSELSGVLLDRHLVQSRTISTPVEVCDVVVQDSFQLIHVKRHLGSRDLSHLFAQGAVSAELVTSNAEFRSLAGDKFDEMKVQGLNPFRSDLKPCVIFAIIAHWNGRSLAQALPFFSKVNLRRTITDLNHWGINCEIGMVAIE